MVERGSESTGSPWSAAIRTLVTALKVVRVNSWNQDVEREPRYRLMGPTELK